MPGAAVPGSPVNLPRDIFVIVGPFAAKSVPTP
jgi:hypothetical protein